MAKKVKEPKTPKDLRKKLMDAHIAAQPTPEPVTKEEGVVTSENDSIYLDWEQTGNDVRISGYVKVTDGDAQFALPVAGDESTFSGIAKSVDSKLFRVKSEDGVKVYKAIGDYSVGNFEYLFVNGNYNVTV